MAAVDYTQNLKDIEQALQGLQNSVDGFSNNITGNSGVNGNPMPNSTTTDYSPYLGKGPAENAYTVLKSIMAYLPNMSHFLNSIDSHISDLAQAITGNNTNTKGGATNANKPSSDFTDLSSTVRSILEEIQGFRKEFNSGVLTKTSDAATNEQIKNNKEYRLAEEAKLEALKIDVEKAANGKGDKSLKEASKAYFNELQKKEKANKAAEKASKGNVGQRLKAKLPQGTGGWASAITGGITAIGKGKLDSSALIDKGISTISQASPLIGGIMAIIKMGFDKYAEQSKLGSQYARTVGGGAFAQNEFIQREARFIDRNSTWKNNYNPDEVFSALTEFASAVGRDGLHQTDKNIKSMIDLKRMGIEADTLGVFDTFGKSAAQVDDYFTKLYSSAGKKGLSFKNVSKAVKDNLKTAQKYTFTNGLKSLTKMAEASTQLKFNMNEVFKLADKVSTVEGTIKTAANLSVLGGEFAQFSNPMSMMYEGLNDPEALQERMISMFGDMAYFDKGKREIAIGAYDKQRIKAAAEAMGVDYGEMLNLSMNNRRGKMVESQLGNNKLDADTISFIKNIAQINERGRAYVELDGKKKYVNELTNEDKTRLQTESERKDQKENATMGDIYNNTRDMYDRLDQILNFLSTKLGVWVAKIANVHFAGNNSAEEYWDNLSRAEKKKYIAKYGNRGAAKSAIGMGQEDADIDNWYGSGNRERGKDIRSYFDAIYNNDQKGDKAYARELHEGKHTRDFEKWVREQGKPREDALGEGYIYGKSHAMGGEFRVVEGGEAILNRTAVNGVGVNNINKFNAGNFTPISNGGNVFNSLNVTPVSYGNPVSTPNLSRDLNVNLTGTFSLSSGSETRRIKLGDIEERELKKFILDAIKESAPQLKKEIGKLSIGGYDKESDNFRGSGSYMRTT